MFAEYTASELTSIFAMQGFAGLILFSVFVLMALVVEAELIEQRLVPADYNIRDYVADLAAIPA